ncbi:MAG: translation elongation factor Ts [Candidatus Ancillula sp.]|nr:translation elongation factor Ts [Candidatus Ancillula sp.]
MANYTAKDISELRELTGAGMMDVKKALDEANGDKQKANEILRVKGAKAAAKRGERETTEGLVASKIVGKKGYLIELNCETDFVAKSPDFIALSEEILDAVVEADCGTLDAALKAKTSSGTTVAAKIEDIAGTKLRENITLKGVTKIEGDIIGSYMHKKDPQLPPYVGVLVALKGGTLEAANRIATHLSGPLAINGALPYATIADVPAEIIESETNIAREKNANKPAKIFEEKILPGSLNAYYKLNVLSEQHFGLDDGQPTIKEILGDGKIVDFKGFLVGAAS